jgi:diacylglycerol O-acyltransferase / wax synthase
VAKKITFLDKAFWLTETDSNPKHVACLQILELPPSAEENYISDFVSELKTTNTGEQPFNCVVKRFLGYPTRLQPIEELDMEYHVQHHQLENIADRESLHKKVALLHEERLHTEKPLWQFHVIESQQGREFVIYIKIHHMYGDGATLVRWFQAAYSAEISTENFIPVWARKYTKKQKNKKSVGKNFLSGLWNFVFATKDLLWIFFRIILKILRLNTTYMPVPFTGTKTVLTGQVKSGRVVTTLDLPFDRVKKLSKKLRATINEVLLCSFDIGIHRFLKEYGQSFDKALFTNMPINLRKPGDNSSGNKIAIVPVELAHGEKDPYLRLRQIIENHRIVIRAAKRSHPASFSYYTVFIQSFSIIYEWLHLSNLVRPIANILISNMPGPKEVRYLKDCELKAVYPISTITPGGGVNITLLTYGDVANVGIVCCDNDIKSLEPLAKYFHDAFDLLERSIDDETLNIDDIGEKVKQKNLSDVVEVQHHH